MKRRKKSQRPLFIPMKTIFFEAFVSGLKNTEFRRAGPRWNEVTCQVGRRATISKGYGKRSRLSGIITSFKVVPDGSKIPGWKECYGETHCSVACVTIQIDRK